MARVFRRNEEATRDDPAREAERHVVDALEAQLGDGYLVVANAGWLAANGEGGHRQGEADVVIAHAEWGLCVLEVKGGRIEIDRDQWYSWDRAGKRHGIKQPVDQASRSARALREKVESLPGWDQKAIPTSFGAVLPHSERPAQDIDAGAPNSALAFAGDLDHLGSWVERLMWKSGAGWSLERRGVELVEQVLVPQKKLVAVQGFEHEEQRILELTEGQHALLGFLQNVPRAAIEGGAGTGKTVLAVEKARRLAAEGFRTLLTCFNRPLAERLQHDLRGEELVVVDTFHGICATLAKATDAEPGGAKDQEYWDVRLPEALVDAVGQLSGQFDAIVVDEGQDFKANWWTPLELLLKDEAKGVIYVFYDGQQGIYSDDVSLPSGLMSFPLRKNVRNTDTIHRLAERHYGGGSFEAAGVPGDPVLFVEAADDHALLKAVRGEVHRAVHDHGLRPSDIAVLSGHTVRRSALAGEEKFGSFAWTKADQSREDRIVFDSIHRFKGLERPYVVLVELNAAKDFERLTYIGVSRARVHLTVIGDAETLARVQGEGQAK